LHIAYALIGAVGEPVAEILISVELEVSTTDPFAAGVDILLSILGLEYPVKSVSRATQDAPDAESGVAGRSLKRTRYLLLCGLAPTNELS
jgi:hypothetical protein